MTDFGSVPAGSVLPVFFSTYGKTNGESITLTGLAVTDIEIYKGTSMTQRSSDAGYTLLDTDGIDVDGITGIHAFSIDTGDNTDAGFFAAGSFYTVVVSAVTIDSQTVNFIAATFGIRAAEGIAGQPKVDVASNAGSAITSAAGIQEVKVASIANNAIAAAAIASDAITAAKIADGAIDAATFAASAITSTVIAADAITAAKIADGAIDAATFAAGAITAAAIATDAIDADALAADALAEIKTQAVAALNTDTYAEPAQGAPAATTTLVNKIGFLYKAWRNKKTQTSSQWSLLNDDAATVDHKSAVSDDGTTATRGEVASGP